MNARRPWSALLALRPDPGRLGLAAALLATALSSWLVLSYDAGWPTAAAPVRHEADYYFEGFHAVRMGHDGQPVQYLSGVRMEHFPDDDSSELSNPLLVSVGGNGPPWELHADRARVTEGGDRVNLPGTVALARAAGPATPALTAHTRDVTVSVAAREAQTDAPVSIVSGGDMMLADGMRLTLEQGRMELLSKVRATYEPNRR